MPGSGGLYSVAIDPWKCTGCLECVDVCGPGALVARAAGCRSCSKPAGALRVPQPALPNTPARFVDGATKPDGDTKRLMLDRNNYYATTGGHGACRGCGEVTAIRLVMATNHAIHDRAAPGAHPRARRPDRAPERQAVDGAAPTSRTRAARAHRAARSRRWRSGSTCFESGPTGNGPASAVIANATGCSSVYASTFPFNPYNDPWVNSLFQDTPALAKGIFEGLTAGAVDDIRALRIAKLELDDAYDPEIHDKFFKTFDWNQFTAGGAGAAADGDQHGRRRRHLRHRLRRAVAPAVRPTRRSRSWCSTPAPIRTPAARPRRRASPARTPTSARFGTAHSGKQEDRKELGLIAAFHPNVFVVQTTHGAAGALPEERHGVPELQRRRRRCSTSTRPARPSTASPTTPPAGTRGWRWRAA